MPGCCSLSDNRNEILFKINISPPLTTPAGLYGVGEGGGGNNGLASQVTEPMDFFLWNHIKALIYLSPVDCCCEGKIIKTDTNEGCVARTERI